MQSGVVAMCSSARVGVGEGVEACSFINFGRPGVLLGSLVAFGLRAVVKRFRGCSAKRLYAFSPSGELRAEGYFCSLHMPPMLTNCH